MTHESVGLRIAGLLIATAGMAALIAGAYFICSQSYKVISYRSAPATIREWRLQSVTEGYQLVALYDYTVGGRQYSSDQAFSTPIWAGPDLHTMVDAGRFFSPDQEAVAFYSPTRPSNAYLLRDELSGHAAFVYHGMIMIVFGFWVFGNGIPSESAVRKRRVMVALALVWLSVGLLCIGAYFTVSHLAHRSWFISVSVIYELLGLLVLLYALASSRQQQRHRSGIPISETEAVA